jgi:acetyl esterase/lipase
MNGIAFDDMGLPALALVSNSHQVVGSAHNGKLRQAGVPVVATRCQGIIHDFVMLNALRGTNAADAAITQAATYLRRSLRTTAPKAR